MSTVNRVFLLGVVDDEPVLKTTPTGAKVAEFVVVTDESYADKEGRTRERTERHRVVAYGKSADFVATCLRKGTRVHVDGKLQTRSWVDDRSGQKRYMTEVSAAEFVLCERA